MSLTVFDDNCAGCKPALLDITTGKAFTDDTPEMQAINRVWASTTRQERHAFHCVTCLNSRTEHDLTIAQALVHRFQLAMGQPAKDAPR